MNTLLSDAGPGTNLRDLLNGGNDNRCGLASHVSLLQWVDEPVPSNQSVLGGLIRIAAGVSVLCRVIAAFLVLSVLGYGTVWAFDWHSADMADHAHGTEHADPAVQADHEGCDHCCHAGAHLIGRARRREPMPHMATTSHLADAVTILISRSTDPPSKHPQS